MRGADQSLTLREKLAQALQVHSSGVYGWPPGVTWTVLALEMGKSFCFLPLNGPPRKLDPSL